jgi:enoyl-[acyl-carrier protein] reductase II
MVSAAESPVHANYKQLVVDADATDTVVLSAHSSPAYRVMRTPLTESLEQEPVVRMHEEVGMDGVLELYFQGNLEAGFAFGGQVAGLVDSVMPVNEIIEGTMAGFYATIDHLGAVADAARGR